MIPSRILEVSRVLGESTMRDDMVDDSVLDMEQIREEMKLVPLPDMCYDDIGADGCFQSMNEVDFESSFDDVEPERPVYDEDRAQQAESRETTRTRAVSPGALELDEGPPPDFSVWTVEDDLLLKNAVEAGAAMEALARGAMRFSRPYTVRELRERWRALLYDPEVSSKACARMVEAEAAFLESLRLMFPSKQKFQDFVRKRRQKSVRATYYKKKRCIEDDKIWEQQGAGQDGEGFGFDDDAFSQMVNLLAVGGVEAVIGDAFPEEDKGPLPQVSSPSKVEQSTPAEEMPEVSCQEHYKAQRQQEQQQEQHQQVAESDSIAHHKADPKENGVSASDNAKSTSVIFEPSSSTADDSQLVAKPPLEVFLLSSDEEDMDGDSGYYSSSPSAKRPRLSSAVVHEKLTCALNTEETEVPEFEDFISSPSSSRQQAPASPDDVRGGHFWSQSEASSDREQEPLSYHRRSAEAPKEDRHLSLPSDNLCFKISLSGKRFDSSRGKPVPYQAQPARRADISSSHQQQPRVSTGPRLMSSSAPATPPSTSAAAVVKTVSPMRMPRVFSAETEPSFNCKLETPDPDGAIVITAVMDSALGVPSPNAIVEEQAVDEIESDDEVASFSDLETLALDMDLDPGEDDVSARAESKLRYKQHRRTLLRLEQGANAAMQRSLLLRGAIAILYGHKLRYLITKDEVSLGRATGDNAVDIDLAQEGAASKVSRQQASIKLKEDGVFYLKNLGRRLLHVNDVAVGTGQHIGLTSNCLIEVGGMGFIFESNRKLVQQRVKDILAAQQQQQQQQHNPNV